MCVCVLFLAHIDFTMVVKVFAGCAYLIVAEYVFRVSLKPADPQATSISVYAVSHSVEYKQPMSNVQQF